MNSSSVYGWTAEYGQKVCTEIDVTERSFTLPVKKAAESSPNTLLRKARQERGWSQKELADLIGVPQPFMISRWENGTGRPGPVYRKKLSSLFGKQYNELGLCKYYTGAINLTEKEPEIRYTKAR